MPLPYNTALTAPPAGYEGLIATPQFEVRSLLASAAIRAGLVVQRGTDNETVSPLAALPAADNDAISTLAAGITAVIAGQTLSGVNFQGAVGQGRIFPPQRLTFTFSNSAGVWGIAALGGSWCRAIGYGPNGEYQIEDFFMPAGGNATVTTDKAWSQVAAVQIGACDAAGGGSTLIIGLSGTTPELGRLDYGFAAYDMAQEPNATATVTFSAADPVDFLRDGTIWVTVEATSALASLVYAPVAVRVVAAGLDVRGQVTLATSAILAAGNFALLSGAYFLDAVAAGSLARVRFGG